MIELKKEIMDIVILRVVGIVNLFMKNFWYIIAFLVWLLIAYVGLSWNNVKNPTWCGNNGQDECPDEFEMRGGDTW